jgi:hypothetical protein
VVKPAEGVHRKFSQNVRWDFRTAVGVHFRFDVGDDAVELSDGDITFGAGGAEAAEHFLARELLAASVALEDLDAGELYGLDGAEAFATGDALAAPADTVIVRAAIGDLGIAEMAVWAAHRLT